MLNLTANVNDPDQQGLLIDFSTTGRPPDQDFVRNDKMLAIMVRPVVPSITETRPWDDDGLPTDTYQVAIGNTDEPPTSGTWPLTIGATTISSNFDITATALQTTLSAAWITAGYSSVTVVSLAPSTFQVTATANGAVPSMTSGTNTLLPESIVSISVQQTGDAGTPAVQIVTLRQSPVAYATPSTALPASGVTSTVSQSGSGTQNKIYSVSFDAPGTYGGTFSMSVTVSGIAQTVGVVSWGASAADITQTLQNYTGSSSSDFGVTVENQIITVEFKGAYGLSNGPVLDVTNIDLLSPIGVSGVINLNTFSLAKAFWSSGAETLSYILAIRRTRASGEDREYLQIPVTLKRNIIDVSTMVPVLFPNYITKAEADTYYQPHDVLLDAYVAGNVVGTDLNIASDGVINGTLNVGVDLDVAGDSVISGGLEVALDSEFLQDVDIDGDLGVAGGVNASSNVVVSVAGKGIQIKEGANAKMGTGTLVAGVAVIATTAALTASRIFLSRSTLGGTTGDWSYTIINATSFTVTSTSLTETSSFVWMIFDPA